jgi:asparagine synthase (glutamine-hydrolysing)
MSAIAGLYLLNHAPIEPEVIGKMTDRMLHRGRDASGIWAEASVGLGHRMLWTTPESLVERLPMQRQHWVITADARIDNRDELIGQLQLDRAETAKITDSDLILAAYEKWGEDCPVHLLGDFAFAIWDGRHQQLFCARDIMGVKPFYYYHGPDRFAFGSEIKALLCVPEISPALSEFRIAELMMISLEDRTRTIYENIHRMPAAHALTVAPGVFRLRRYYRLDHEYELKLGSDAEYAEAYREIFEKSVRCRMRTAFPIGSMLSGGMDSSSIACVARNHIGDTNQSTLHTFSTRFDGLPEERRIHADETFYVHKVLDQGGFTPHFIDGDRLDPMGAYAQMFEHTDEPFFAPNLYYNWAWYQCAQQNQVRVLLDGIDGDSTVSHGQMYLYELVKRHRYMTFLRQIRAYSRLMGKPISELFWQWGVQTVIPDAVGSLSRRINEYRQPEWREFGIDRDFAERLKLSSYHLRVSNQQFDEVPVKTARHAHWYSLNSGLISYALDIADKVSAAFGVELRFPFCDRRLMEFCLSLPPEQKFNYGWARLIARRGMQGVLPDEIRERVTKANLGANTKPNLLDRDRDTIEHRLFQDDALNGYVDRAKLRQIYNRYCQDSMDEKTAITVYGLTSLAMWLAHQRNL